MRDDIFNKLKNKLSGSVKLNKTASPADEKNIIEEELVNTFMNQILDASWVEEDLKATCAPSYHLSKKNKTYWLMNTTVKSLMHIKGGIELIPIENGDPNSICLIGHSMFSIPNNLIICSGWN